MGGALDDHFYSDYAGYQHPNYKGFTAELLESGRLHWNQSRHSRLVFLDHSIFRKERKHREARFCHDSTWGFLGFVFSQYLTSLSLQYTTPVYFSLILALSPVVVMLLQAICFGEKITTRKTLGSILGILGAAILAIRAAFETGSQGTNNLLGIAFAVVSVRSFAAYVVICGDISKKYRPITQMKWIFTLSAFLTCPVWYLTRMWETEKILHSVSYHIGILEIGFIIVFCTIAAYTLIPIGMRTVNATVVSIYMNLQPIVASITAIIVGMDVFTWDKPLALLLV